MCLTLFEIAELAQSVERTTLNRVAGDNLKWAVPLKSLDLSPHHIDTHIVSLVVERHHPFSMQRQELPRPPRQSTHDI